MKLLDWFFGVSAVIFVALLMCGSLIGIYYDLGIIGVVLLTWGYSIGLYFLWRVHQ